MTSLLPRRYRARMDREPTPGWELPAPWVPAPDSGAPGVPSTGALTVWYSTDARDIENAHKVETERYREGFRKYFKAGWPRPLPPTTHLADSDTLEAALPRENRPSDVRMRGRERRRLAAARKIDPGIEESDEDED